MDRNFVIAMVLMLVVFFAWQSFFGPEPAPPAPETTPVEGQTPSGEEPAQQELVEAPTPVSGGDLESPPTEPDGDEGAQNAIAATSQVPIEQFVVENDLYMATVTNDGGVITSWMLKEYNDKPGKEGTPLEMIWSAKAGRYALATEFGDATPSLTSYDDYEFVERDGSRVVMRRLCEDGLEVTKELTFSQDKYLVTLALQVKNTASQPIQGQARVLTFAPAEQVKRGFFSPPKDFISLLSVIDDKFSQKEVFKVEPQEVPGSELLWSGFATNYFMLAVAPKNTSETKLITERPSENMVEARITAFNQRLMPGETHRFEYACYVGPKQEDALIAAEHKFDLSRDFGWFSSIARMLVRVLNFFYKYVHNYGVAIIIVTIIIKILLLPLTQKSYKSMKAMQALQPEIKLLREQHGNDKNLINQKMMELYKKHKVNPASGCLPLLLQLPIFIAFYRALYVSIEMRHTPFFGWIQDLSAPDPYYITPILMGATMVLTQKMTPTSADPMQAKMMMAMPVVFTFLFLNFPSGLVIYWLINNILTIFQQLYINRPEKGEQESSVPAVAAGAKQKKRK